MTQREIVRTAFVLGGIWLVFSGFASLPSVFANFAEVASRTEREASDLFGDLLRVHLPSGLMGVALAALPGVYAIFSCDRWAARLVPNDDTSLEIRPSLILAVGAMLLGLSTGVSGAIALAASGANLLWLSVGGKAGEFLAGMMLERSLYGAFAMLAGVLLFLWGSRVVLRAA